MNIKEILQKHGRHKEQLLKILHDIQEADPHNHIAPEAMQAVARWMDLPLSSVYGVLKYYSMYSTEPRGKHLIRVCNSVVCKMQGSDNIRRSIEEMVSTLEGQQAGSHLFSVETTECLGYCEAAPAVMVDDATVGPVLEGDVAGLLNQLKNKTL